MNIVASLLAKLGLNNSEFKANLKDSVDETKNFEKSWKDIGKLFAAGGLTTAVLGFFRSMIEHARDSKGAFDENTEAVKRFGDSWDGITTGAKDAGVWVLGWLNRIGEEIGIFIKGWLRGFGVFVDSIKTLDFKGALGALSKGLAEVRKEEAVLHETEKSLFETQQKIAQQGEANAKRTKREKQEEEKQIKALEKAEKEAADAREKAADEQIKLMDKKAELQYNALSIEEKIKRLTAEQLEITISIERMKREGIDTDHAEVALLEVQAKLAKAKGEQKQKEEKITRDLLKSETEIGEMTQENLLKFRDIVRAKIMSLEAEGGVTDELRKQLDLIDRMVRKKKEELDITLKIRGRTDEDLTDRELQAKLSVLQDDLTRRGDMLSKMQGGVAYGGAPQDPMLKMMRDQFDQAARELQARNTVRRQVDMYGEEGASRFYGTNMPEFERLLRLATPQTDAKQTVNLLQDIQQRLSGAKPIFGQKPGG
jgi:hypothetical protein